MIFPPSAVQKLHFLKMEKYVEKVTFETRNCLLQNEQIKMWDL